MINIKKVIAGLKCLADENVECHSDCPYYEDRISASCFRSIARNALTLLQKQEPVEPKWFDFEDMFTEQKYKIPICGACESLLGDAVYCPQCGRKVKWDGA